MGQLREPWRSSCVGMLRLVLAMGSGCAQRAWVMVNYMKHVLLQKGDGGTIGVQHGNKVLCGGLQDGGEVFTRINGMRDFIDRLHAFNQVVRTFAFRLGLFIELCIVNRKCGLLPNRFRQLHLFGSGLILFARIIERDHAYRLIVALESNKEDRTDKELLSNVL